MLLSPASPPGLQFDPRSVESRKIAELVFPVSDDDSEGILEKPVQVHGDIIALNEQERERRRRRFARWIARCRKREFGLKHILVYYELHTVAILTDLVRGRRRQRHATDDDIGSRDGRRREAAGGRTRGRTNGVGGSSDDDNHGDDDDDDDAGGGNGGNATARGGRKAKKGAKGRGGAVGGGSNPQSQGVY